MKDLAIPWEAQMLFDMTVFGLTLIQSYKHRENLRWFRGLETERSGTLGLVELLFRDGELCPPCALFTGSLDVYRCNIFWVDI